MALTPFGPFRYDLAARTLERDGQPLAVSQRGLLLLGTLLEAGGMVVSKDDLLHCAWPGTVVEESNLTVQIAALRKVLGRTRDGYDWIVTVPRVGYRLVLPQSEGASISAAAGRALVAVMPFANLAGGPDEAGLIEGLVDDIITELSRFKTFAVVGVKDPAADARLATGSHRRRSLLVDKRPRRCRSGEVIELARDGLSLRDIAEEAGLSKSAVHRLKKRAEADGHVFSKVSS